VGSIYVWQADSLVIDAFFCKKYIENNKEKNVYCFIFVLKSIWLLNWGKILISLLQQCYWRQFVRARGFMTHLGFVRWGKSSWGCQMSGFLSNGYPMFEIVKLDGRPFSHMCQLIMHPCSCDTQFAWSIF
jgi:hypothetical protein